MNRMLAGAVAVLAILGAAAGVSLDGEDAPVYTSLDGTGEPLRSTFDEDVGKVRVLMLVAPT